MLNASQCERRLRLSSAATCGSIMTTLRFRCRLQSRSWRDVGSRGGYSTEACQSCGIKNNCTTGKERRITRWEHEQLLEAVPARRTSGKDANVDHSSDDERYSP